MILLGGKGIYGERKLIMGMLNYNYDAINTAMLNGLKEAFKDELKQTLMKTAEEEIEPIVEKICKRLELNISNHPDYLGDSRQINLEWLLTREK